MATTGNGTSELRIARKYPGIAWQRVWTNVHTNGLRPHKINVVCCHTRNNTDQRTFGCNSSHQYNVLREMGGNRYTNTTHTPKTHTRGVDPTPDFPSLAPPKAGGDNMDRGPPSSIPSPDTATPLSYRLHGLLATRPLERVPPNTQDTHSTKVPGCAIVPPSPSAPDSFNAGLKGDSKAPYISGQQTPAIPTRTHHGWQ